LIISSLWITSRIELEWGKVCDGGVERGSEPAERDNVAASNTRKHEARAEGEHRAHLFRKDKRICRSKAAMATALSV